MFTRAVGGASGGLNSKAMVALCQHGKRREICRRCGGSSICEHGKRRACCRECGGSSLCQHGRQRARCRECGGSSICQHDRQRNSCAECQNFVCTLGECNGRRFCAAASLAGHMASHHAENPRALTKRKELAVHQALVKGGVDFDYQFHITFDGCGLGSESKRAFVDFVIPRPWGYLFVEVDEGQHNAYDPSCDVRRDFDIAASLLMGVSSKIAILHYNPDAYHIGSRKMAISAKERHKRLLEVVDMEPAGFERWFLFYKREFSDDTLPSVARHWAPHVCECSRIVDDARPLDLRDLGDVD